MKNSYIFSTFVVLLILIVLASNSSSVFANVVSPKIKDSQPELKTKVADDLDAEPSIFHNAYNSDFVVVAVLDKEDYVSKINKQDQPDLRDLVAGFIYSFKVEKILCSRESFSTKKIPKQLF